MEDFSHYINNLEITVDKRLVLLSIIEILSNYKEKYPFLLADFGNKDYCEEIKEYFPKYKNHSVINLFNDITKDYDFSFSRPIKLFLQLDENFSLNNFNSSIFTDEFIKDPRVYQMLKQVREFASLINFNEFYTKKREAFLEFINNVKNQLDNKPIDTFISDYLGVSNNKFIVSLIFWRTYGCYGTHNDNNIYCHLCAHHTSKTEKEIYPQDVNIFNYASFLVHEFLHSFINPLVDQSRIDINFDKEDMTKGYTDNKSILKDYIVRAITLRYLYFHDRDNYNKQISMDLEFGFKYIKDAESLLIEYENNRDIYLKFSDYIEVFIVRFKNIIVQQQIKK